MNVRTIGHQGTGVLRVLVWACAVALAVTGCGGGSGNDSAATPSATASTVAGSASGSGLAPRPDLPPLAKGELAACLPLCAKGRVVPGDLPLGAYQTQWFFGGYMTLRTERAWTGLEDSTGELKIAPATDSEYGVGFALDLHPVLNGQRVDSVPMTAAALLDWLGGNANLEVSKPTATSIGNLPATAVDIRLSKAAVNDDPVARHEHASTFWASHNGTTPMGSPGMTCTGCTWPMSATAEPTMSSRSPSKAETAPTSARSCQRWSGCWRR
jgi:hypothetical protein